MSPAQTPEAARSRVDRTLSLAIPMRNEAAVLGLLFEHLDATLPPLDVACEIVCIYDAERPL